LLEIEAIDIMQKKKRYKRTFYAPKAILEGYDALEQYVRAHPDVGAEFGEKEPALSVWLGNLTVNKDDVSLNHDSEEEFFTDYRRNPDSASYTKHIGSCCFSIHFHNNGTDVEVECSSRQAIEAVFNRIEDHAVSSKLPEPPEPPEPEPPESVIPKPKIFIGHGRCPLWRELKDHLADKHKYEVIAYEVGSRAGHTIRDILEDMLNRSSIAFLVLTGEDRDDSDNFHARENVIHETGLFQGRLGFSRSIVILEEGTAEFSNIHGIDQLRFLPGNIKEVFGDVIAVIKREFSDF